MQCSPFSGHPTGAEVQTFGRVCQRILDLSRIFFFKMMDFLLENFLSPPKNIKLFFLKKEADAYVVETDDANKRVRTLLGFDPVYTVSNTCGAQYFQPEPVAKKLPERQPDEFRLLTVSAYYLHKNLEIIPSVIDILNNNPSGKNIRFVLTLKPGRLSKDHSPKIPRSSTQYRTCSRKRVPISVSGV